MNTIWVPVSGYEGLYEVSNQGQVRSLRQGRALGPCYTGKYYCVGLTLEKGQRRTIKIHRLVANAFIPKIAGKTHINHIDGDKENNAASNLEWCSNQDNVDHALRTGLRKFSSSGAVGIQKVKHGWRALLRESGRLYHIGVFTSLEEAVAARNVRLKQKLERSES